MLFNSAQRVVPALFRQRTACCVNFMTTSTNNNNSNNKSNSSSNKEWRERLQQWETTLSMSKSIFDSTTSNSNSSSLSDQAVALCDVGFAYHQGTVPSSELPHTTLPVDLTKAKTMYKQSAALKYAPAASLLADVYFYHSDNNGNGNKNSNTNDSNNGNAQAAQEQASRWCHTTLQLTDPTLPEDAYLRSRSHQKLGILEYQLQRNQHHTPQSQLYFQQALDGCQKHLGGNWPFLLSHDPPGLYELLQQESDDLDNVPQLQNNLSGFHTPPDWKIANPESIVTLRNYTRALRNTETKDSTFALSLQKESLDLFSSSNGSGAGGGNWGVTYLSSFFQILGNPLIQQTIAKKKNVQMVVLGSALGNACVWPAAAFGAKAVGFDIMETCVNRSHKLIEGLAGKGGERLRKLVQFKTLDVLEELTEVQKAIHTHDDTNRRTIVWSNDYSWGTESQILVENKAFEAMRSGDVIVLYRPPRTLGANKWSRGGKINNVAVSWNAHSTMYILIK